MIEALHLNISRNIASSEADIAKFCNLLLQNRLKEGVLIAGRRSM